MSTMNVREARRITRVGEMRAFALCVKHSRFSVITLFVGLALLLSDQGRDLLIAYAEDGKTARLALAAAIWAFSTWFWCRILLDIDYDDKPDCVPCFNRWRSWMPRILGTLAFAAVALSAFQEALWELFWWTVGGLVVFLAFFAKRRDLSERLSARLKRSPRERMSSLAPMFAVRRIAEETKPPYATLWDALYRSERSRFPGLVALAMVITFALLCVLAFVNPVGIGKSGAMILFFAWAATWLPIGSWMSYVADKHGLPLLSVLALLALASSFFNDNHEIRSASRALPVASRPSVSEALAAWAKANALSATEARPFVLVATAGGGIRAAYWTGTVLGELDAKADAFRERLFAVSGVSGGSVGATVYRSLIALPRERLKEKCPKGVTQCAQKILGTDSLGALAAAMLYPDLGQRFFPLPWFPDRAAALEQAWESAFMAAAGENGLESSLAGLAKPWPALFLNATWSDAGRRIVASNLRYADADAFVRSKDQLAVLGHDLRLSTAAHNSARFPYVSPPGMWLGKDGKIAGRLQDGGLFENYGAETALEILELACRTFECVAPGGESIAPSGRPRISIVAILITSDPTLPKKLADIPKTRPISFGYEVRSTLSTYERVRGGRGTEAATRLEEWVQGKGRFYQFRMCEGNAKDVQPPLGWALSDAAQARISSYLLGDGENPPECYADNAEAAREIERLLGGGASAEAGAEAESANAARESRLVN